MLIGQEVDNRLSQVLSERETVEPRAIWDDWRTWLTDNYIFWVPLMVAIVGPVTASVMTISYDYLKSKGLIK